MQLTYLLCTMYNTKTNRHTFEIAKQRKEYSVLFGLDVRINFKSKRWDVVLNGLQTISSNPAGYSAARSLSTALQTSQNIPKSSTSKEYVLQASKSIKRRMT